MTLNSAVTDFKWSPNFSSGRPAGDPNMIVIHHWGVDGQSHQGVVDYLCREDGNTSAHYVASAGRVTQLVHDYDRAWHAGTEGNPRGIGIECRPEMSAGDFETVAKLIAAIRAEWGDLPLHGHQDYMNTSCPGRWYSQLDRLDARARQIAGGSSVTPAPASQPTAPACLDVDGYLGALTVTRLQQLLGTTADGVISGQWPGSAEYLPALVAVDYSDGGSQAVAALQAKLSVNADGYLGPNTVKAWQRRLGVTPDGYLGTATGAAIQRALNNGRIY